MSFLLALAARTARLSIGAGGGAFTGLVFFLSVVAVVPFGVGPDLPLLARIGPRRIARLHLRSPLRGRRFPTCLRRRRAGRATSQRSSPCPR